MKILAFDLATYTGVAVGSSDVRPLCLTERLGDTGASQGARFEQAFRMTRRLVSEHKPDVIAIEEPIASGVTGAKNRVQLAMGLRAIVFAVANMHRIPVREYHVGSIRKHFIGRGNLKRDAAKSSTIRRCELLGWVVANDNEADAAAVWDFARARLAKRSTMPRGLFDGHDNQL